MHWRAVLGGGEREEEEEEGERSRGKVQGGRLEVADKRRKINEKN